MTEKYPEKYLEVYLSSDPKLEPENKQLISRSIYKRRQLRSWLKYLRENIKFAYRPAFIFPYRNLKAREVAQVIVPQEIKTYSLVKLLNLFAPLPRSIPQLEQLIDAVKTNQLDHLNLLITTFKFYQEN